MCHDTCQIGVRCVSDRYHKRSLFVDLPLTRYPSTPRYVSDSCQIGVRSASDRRQIGVRSGPEGHDDASWTIDDAAVMLLCMIRDVPCMPDVSDRCQMCQMCQIGFNVSARLRSLGRNPGVCTMVVGENRYHQTHVEPPWHTAGVRYVSDTCQTRVRSTCQRIDTMDPARSKAASLSKQGLKVQYVSGSSSSMVSHWLTGKAIRI